MKNTITKIKIVVATFSLLISGMSVNAATFTATTSGNWSSATTWGGTAPGNNITFDQVTIPAGINVTLDQNVVFNGLLASLDVNGSLTSATTDSLMITQGALGGSGTMTLSYLSFGATGSMGFSGTLNVDKLENSSINLSVGSTINLNDTLSLQAGSFSLASGGVFTLMSSSNIKVDGGSIVISGGLLNSTNNYNVIYVGGNKTSGIELSGSGLQDVYVNLNNNSQSVSLGANSTINATLTLQRGNLDLNGNDLTIKGDFIYGGGSFEGSALSSLTFDISNGTDTVKFVNGSQTIGSLTYSSASSGTMKLGSSVNIANKLSLSQGAIELSNNSALTMNAGSEIEREYGVLSITSGSSFVGTANYDVTYICNSKYSGVELTGSGLNDLTLQLKASNDSITLSNNINVNGTLDLSEGILNMNGYDVEIMGDYTSQTTGYFSGNSQSNLVISTGGSLTDTIRFMVGREYLDSLIINTITNADIVLGSPLTTDNVSLNSGSVVILGYDLTINSTGEVVGYDNTKYIKIDGGAKLIQTVNVSAPYKTFPVGNLNSYSPAHIQINSGATDKYAVNIKNGVYDGGTSGQNSAHFQSVVDRTWNISRSAGTTTDMNLQLEWMSSAEVNGFDRSQSYISHYTSSWDAVSTSSATSTTAGYMQTRLGITSLSPFSVADNQAALGIEEDENMITQLYPNPVKNDLTINYQSEESVDLKVIDITGKVVYTERLEGNGVGLKTRIDFSNYPSGVYLIQLNTNTQKITKKIIKS